VGVGNRKKKEKEVSIPGGDQIRGKLRAPKMEKPRKIKLRGRAGNGRKDPSIEDLLEKGSVEKNSQQFWEVKAREAFRIGFKKEPTQGSGRGT